MSNQTKNGGPAFPRPIGEYKEVGAGGWNKAQGGMTLRDYFAAKAMQGLLMRQSITGVVDVNRFQHKLAESSYKIADAMLETDARGH